ncbi:MAG: D-2-hydroxyacid dehydrogenase [Thermoguttaceae bacterium]
MKIVVLDGKTLNPGDLSWEPIRVFGELTVYDYTPLDLILERAREATVLITNKTVLTAETIKQLPDLRFIALLATGTNAVDLKAARERNIPVSNVPKYSTHSVAQCTFAHIFNLTYNLGLHSRLVHEGGWSKCVDFCFWQTPLVELYDKNLGIFGYGEIGKAVAKAAQGFGMNTLAYGPRLPKTGSDEIGTRFVNMSELLEESDVVSLHCPLNDENAGVVNTEFLSLMKPTAFLINTARGGLIVEQDLAEALNTGRIAGAGLDVLAKEPPPSNNPLLNAKNCYITPHIAWATLASRKRLMDATAENLLAFQLGRPKNVVN